MNPYSRPHRRRLWNLGHRDGQAGRFDPHLAEKPEGYTYKRGYSDGEKAQAESEQPATGDD